MVSCLEPILTKFNNFIGIIGFTGKDIYIGITRLIRKVSREIGGLNQLEHISLSSKARREDELPTPVHNAQLHFGEEGSNPNLFHILGASLHGET